MIILIVIVFKAVYYQDIKKGQAILNQIAGKQIYELEQPSFLQQCIMVILTVSTIAFLLLGVVSVYLGCEKNAALSKIRQEGMRITGKVIHSEIKKEYSTASDIVYTYNIAFEIDGEQKRSATMSSAHFAVGDAIDIYYLPYNHGKIGGSAVADVVDDSPGKTKIYSGIAQICVAFILICLQLFIKSRNKPKREWRLNEKAVPKTAGADDLQNQSLFVRLDKGEKYAIMQAFAIILFTVTIILIFLGVYENMVASRIREHGIRTTGTIIQSEQQETYSRGSVPQEEYLVEFVADGEKRKGKAVSKEIFLLYKEVDIYYLADAKGEIIDVIFADVNDYPGRNKIYSGILALLIAIGLYLESKKAGY
ncbi:MAG: hypothetical protein K2H34_03725 [Lachnospiraceae bacterium]|nr:hypothetical protein [Lachnospiraceae bacterium]